MTSEEKIKFYFKKYIFEWLFNDISINLTHQSNFGAFTLICCAIDAFGGLYLGCRKTSRDTFKGFVRKYFSKECSNYIDDIWTDFRCGFVHYLAPKSQYGIIRGSENPYFQKIKKQYSDREEERLVINLDLFWQDFQEAIRKYYNELLEDEGLKRNFFSRIKYLVR